MSWGLIITLSLVTFAARLSFIALSSLHAMPGWMKLALQYVPPAAFATIVMPQLLLHDNVVISSVLEPRLIAAVVSALVTLWLRNLPLALASGMGSLWLMQWLLP